jgi:hypothetical protein
MGLSSENFWRLTWWDWGMEVFKMVRSNQKHLEEREFYLAVERIKIADFKNAHFRTESGQPLDVKPEDIFQLSYDKIRTDVDERPVTFKEAKALYGSKFKRK